MGSRNGGTRTASDALFPDASVVVADGLLLGVYTGIVPDGVAGLGIGDIDWAGDAAVLLCYVKGRTAAESLTLPRRAVRLWSSGWSTPPRSGATRPPRCGAPVAVLLPPRQRKRWPILPTLPRPSGAGAG